MENTTVEWLGNRVQLQDIEATGLTLVQWHRPIHGAWRGACVLDAEELRQVRVVLDRLDLVRRGTHPADDAGGDGAHHLRDDLAGSPVHLESLLEDLLER